MPKREYRDKYRKKTRYSSDSSDDYREKSSRSYRERSRKKSSEKYRNRKRHSSSERDSSTSSTKSSTSSDYSHSKSRSASRTNHSSRSSSIQKKKSSVPQEPEPVAKKFELDDLYKEKDRVKALEDIESDTFKQATFKQSSKIIVDLQGDKILAPSSSTAALPDESLIHPNFLGDNDKRVDKWIKKLYIYRNQ